MGFPIVRTASGVLFVAAATVSGITFFNSKSNYDKYEQSYDRGVEEVKASFPALPESVFFDNGFITYSGDQVVSTKSKFKNSTVYGAREATVAPLNASVAQTYEKLDDDENLLSECISGLNRKGGAITFTINTETYGESDIEIAMRTNWFNKAGEYFALENVTDYIKIQVNKLEVKTVEEELDNDHDNFSSLILHNTHLIKGINTVTITTDAYNDKDNKDDYLYVIPDIRNLTVITDAEVVKPEIEEAE